jgi:maltooligosyltrehalose trehalohydrolase
MRCTTLCVGSRHLPIGAELSAEGVHFRVWAPGARRVSLVLEGQREVLLEREATGHHAVFVPRLAAGTRYRLRLDDDAMLYPDPASRFQPEGPFGPSEVVDPADYTWSDAAWRGVTEPHRQVLYEMHVGTFTREGTWAAAAEQLQRLAELGITMIEMMPVNEFAGARGWGYDGVDLFAPFHAYGKPRDLRRFIDRAHAAGIAVILDVVYNHFGPAGNFLFRFAPELKYTGPGKPGEWGDRLDYVRPGVREYFIANAGYWIDEFHFDGLRLDATQAICDDSDCHLVGELTRRVRSAAGTRRVFLVGESEPQDRKMLEPLEAGGCGLDALWNDDFHHTARVRLTGVTDGYLHDYRGTPQELVSAVKRGFLYQGQMYAWQRNTRGSPTRGFTRARFVHFLENHDQIANNGFGERLTTLADPALLRAMTALLLLGPELPMLFQGQEWGAREPWHYFVDHEPELAALVRRGRAEFVGQFARTATPEAQAALADPTLEATFRACVVERRSDTPLYKLHRDLLALRRSDAVLTDERVELDGAVLGPDAFCLRWLADDPPRDRLLLVNLGATFRESVLPEPLLAPPENSGWRLAWSSEHPEYGGHGTPEPFTRERLAIPARAAVLCVPDPARCLRVDPAESAQTAETAKPDQKVEP